MRVAGWDSASLLNLLARVTRLDATRARWWHMHGARLVDALAISGGALLLALVAWVVWRRRAGLVGSRAGIAGRHIWMALLAGVFAGSGLLFSALSLPNRVDNARRLAPMVGRLPGPIYTDQFTYDELAYVLRYRTEGMLNRGALDDRALRSLLDARQGCIIVNEPELDQLTDDGFRVAPAAYGLLERRPAGWALVERFPSADNPLEHVAVVCARGAARGT